MNTINSDIRFAVPGPNESEDPSPASEYIRKLVLHGPSTLIDNAQVEVESIKTGGIYLPIVIGNPKHRNADACSPYSHYVRYTLEELIKRNKNVPKWIFEFLLRSFGLVLKICDIDRVVYINNWLFATNPHQPLSTDQIHSITTLLKKKYPCHAIVHRTINPYLHRCFYDALLENGYRMAKSRLIYLIDPASEQFQKRKCSIIDHKLLKRTPYQIVENRDLTDVDFSRMTELYRSLYLNKHSFLNPQLNAAFFSFTIQNNILEARALKKDGRIDGFATFYCRDDILTGAFVGYDRTLPQKAGLYRQIIAILILEAQKRGMLLNLSGGAGKFKKLRGAFPVVEYDAIYDRHLTWRRRLGWWLIRKEGEAWKFDRKIDDPEEFIARA